MSTEGNGPGGTPPGAPPPSDQGSADRFGVPTRPAGPPAYPPGPFPPPGPPSGPGFGGPLPEQPRPPVWLFAGLGVVVLVAAVAIGGIFFVKRDGTPLTGRPTVQPAPSRTSVPSPTSSRGSTPTRTPSGSATSADPKSTPSPPPVTAVVPGWTAVGTREFVAFDVPPEWKVESPGTLAGFETSGGTHDIVIMHNTATYKSGACPESKSSDRGKAGFVSPKGQTAATAATEISRQWATLAGVHKDGSASPISDTVVTPIKIAGNTLDASMATTTLTVTEPDTCPAPTMSFTAVSFEKDGAVVVFMLYANQGVPDALPQDVATKVIGSLRPIGP